MRISYKMVNELCQYLNFELIRTQCLGNKAANYYYEYKLENKDIILIDWSRNLKKIYDYIIKSEEYKKLMEVK